MTRREILASAPVAVLAAAAAAAPADPLPPHQYPTMQQLIALAESAPTEADRIYYGRLLAQARPKPAASPTTTATTRSRCTRPT